MYGNDLGYAMQAGACVCVFVCECESVCARACMRVA
jgi:hypothetical protein